MAGTDPGAGRDRRLDLAVYLSGPAEEGGFLSANGYRRLPGTRRGFFSRSSVWAGSDHILLVEGSRISETYKRIYFRDVQALVIARRNRFIVQAPWLLVPPALIIAASLSPAAWQASGTEWLIATLIMVAIAVYLYVAAFFYGCRFYIATAVGNVRVASIFRVWQARRFHEKVTPLVIAAQRTPPIIKV